MMVSKAQGGLGTTESPIYHRRRRKGTDGYSTISVFDEMRRGGTLSGDQDQATEAERQRQSRVADQNTKIGKTPDLIRWLR